MEQFLVVTIWMAISIFAIALAAADSSDQTQRKQRHEQQMIKPNAVDSSLYTQDDDFETIKYFYYSPNPEALPPPCIDSPDQLIFEDGMFLAGPSFLVCLERVPGSSFIPVFWNGSYHGQLPIYSSLVMNNLVRIDEVQSTVELTFDLTLKWEDHRYAMPDYWDNVPMGFVDLTSTVLGNSSMLLWKPSPAFPDAIDIDIFNQDFRLNRANQFYWQISYHMVLSQPQFNFAMYPADQQNINIRFADSEFELRELKFIPEGIAFTTLSTGKNCFASNPIWDYLGSDYTSYEDAVYQNSYNVYEIQVVRRAYGVVIRLVLPMALLILLGSITFWVSYDHRVDVTITILLAMSALYIVILQNIPLVGYLTNVDRFVFWMYFMLVLMAAVHQLYATLTEKLDRWPLRLVYLRLIEVSGRVFTLPAVVIYFAVYIPVSDNPDVPTFLLVLSVCIGFVVFVRESFGIRSSVYDAMRALTEKVNDPNLRVEDLSWVEAVALNVFYFKTLSTSKLLVSQHLATHGSFVVKVRRPLHLKNLSNFMSLLQGQNKADNQGPKQKMTGERTGLRMSRIFNKSKTRPRGMSMFLDDEFDAGAYTEDDFRQVQAEYQQRAQENQGVEMKPQRSSSRPETEEAKESHNFVDSNNANPEAKKSNIDRNVINSIHSSNIVQNPMLDDVHKAPVQAAREGHRKAKGASRKPAFKPKDHGSTSSTTAPGGDVAKPVSNASADHAAHVESKDHIDHLHEVNRGTFGSSATVDRSVPVEGASAIQEDPPLPVVRDLSFQARHTNDLADSDDEIA